MARYHVNVTLPRTSGIPEDAVVNTFNFTSDIASTPVIDDFTGLLAPFYNSPNPVAPLNQSICDYIGQSVSRAANACTVEVYEVGETFGPLGSPVMDGAFTLGATEFGTGFELPAEVALAFTYHAAIVGVAENVPGGVAGPAGDSRPRARRRGRVYIGPLRSNSVQENAALQATATSTLRHACQGAGARLLADSAASPLTWCVWSRTDMQFRAVTGGWIDDSFDTIRSRGRDTEVRSIWGSLS